MWSRLIQHAIPCQTAGINRRIDRMSSDVPKSTFPPESQNFLRWPLFRVSARLESGEGGRVSSAYCRCLRQEMRSNAHAEQTGLGERMRRCKSY